MSDPSSHFEIQFFILSFHDSIFQTAQLKSVDNKSAEILSCLGILAQKFKAKDAALLKEQHYTKVSSWIWIWILLFWMKFWMKFFKLFESSETWTITEQKVKSSTDEFDW